MDIIITSKNENPSNFVSNFISSINIADGYEIGVKSIHHGPLFNVTAGHNVFTVGKKPRSSKIPNKILPETLRELVIEPGFYEIVEEILVAIYEAIYKTDSLRDFISFSYGDSYAKLDFKGGWSFCHGTSIKSDLLRLLGLHTLKALESTPFLQHGEHIVNKPVTQIGMLYSNIVTNMTIDQQRSRLIAMIPLSSTAGYNFKEFVNPMYRPLSVSSFIDINFILTDLEGNLLEFDHDYPTVIHLHIRKNR